MIFGLIFGVIISSELVIRLPLVPTVKRIMWLVAKIGKVISSEHISDIWKQKALPYYSFQLFVSSLKIFVFILIIVAPIFGFGIVISGSIASTIQQFQNGFNLMVISLVAVLYILLRLKIANG